MLLESKYKLTELIYLDKKLYGSISIKDMINRTRYDETMGIQGYHYNPELRFNFNRNHKIP